MKIKIPNIISRMKHTMNGTLKTGMNLNILNGVQYLCLVVINGNICDYILENLMCNHLNVIIKYNNH